MVGTFWVIGGVLAALLVVAALLWRPIRTALRNSRYERARKDFHRQRERLEAKFVQLAGNSGKPRGLRWVGCEFDDGVAYARDRHSGDLCAFVAVTISFEAIEGGLMEGVEAVGNLRAASAMFRLHGDQWRTDGRAIFNLNPAEAIAHYRDELESVGCEVAQRL